MKTNPTFSHLVLTVIILLLLGGCNRNNDISPVESEVQDTISTSDEISIDRAKQLYESFRSQEQRNVRKRNGIEAPHWEGAKKLRFQKGEKALVIPIFEMPESATLMTVGSVPDKSKLTLMDLVTPVQLVMYKDKEGNEVVERMYSKSDPKYRKRKKNQTEDKDFSGMRWFEDENGNFKRGFIYENGEVVKTFYPSMAGARTLCQTHTFTLTIDYYSIACVQGYGCGDPIFMYSQSYSYTYQDCQGKHDDEYVIPGGGGGGGGGWGTSVNDFLAFEGWTIPEDRVYQFLNWVADLNPQESAWVIANPWKAPAAWWNKTKANGISQQRYMCHQNGDWYVDDDGTNQNAYKHAYWSALNQRSFGSDVAHTIGDNHEGDVTSTDLNVQMDLWNNQLGRKVAETCECDGEQLKEAIYQALSLGLGKRRQMAITSTEQNYLFNTSSATTLCDDF